MKTSYCDCIGSTDRVPGFLKIVGHMNKMIIIIHNVSNHLPQSVEANVHPLVKRRQCKYTKFKFHLSHQRGRATLAECVMIHKHTYIVLSGKSQVQYPIIFHLCPSHVCKLLQNREHKDLVIHSHSSANGLL